MECTKCGRKSIKYRCIGCKTPICNVCSVSCVAETPGYCEENYLVGKCEECHGNNRKRKSSCPLPLSKSSGQCTLSSFLKVKTKTPFLRVETDARKDVSQRPDSTPSSSSKEESASTFTLAPLSGKQRSRKLSVATANSWVTTNLAAPMAQEWLVINEDKTGYVVSLNCAVCKTYADKLRGLKNFSMAWAFSGTTNLPLSNAEDHARGEPHKRALDLHLKEEKGRSAAERAKVMGALNTSGQQLITSGIANMKAIDHAKTKTKFEVAYFVAKQELPLSKYP